MDKYLKPVNLFDAPGIIEKVMFGEYVGDLERRNIINTCMTPSFSWFVGFIQPLGPLTSAIAAADLWISI